MVTKVQGLQLSIQNASDDDLFKLSSNLQYLHFSPNPTFPTPLYGLNAARSSFMTVKNLSIWTMAYLVKELYINCIFHNRRK